MLVQVNNKDILRWKSHLKLGHPICLKIRIIIRGSTCQLSEGCSSEIETQSKLQNQVNELFTPVKLSCENSKNVFGCKSRKQCSWRKQIVYQDQQSIYSFSAVMNAIIRYLLISKTFMCPVESHYSNIMYIYIYIGIYWYILVYIFNVNSLYNIS